MKRIFLIGVFFLLILSLPAILWFLETEKQIEIAVIDKTVPDETYREHQGITWLLKHLKYTNTNNELYDIVNDYFGFVPNESEESYDIRPLPTNYAAYDVIYLADTYGVYEDDLPWIEKEREGARSEKIYGGLEEAEWNAISDRLQQQEKSLLIAEYNTFASPTDAVVREKVTDFLGLEWSGWTGRYFSELDPEKNQEIPQWIVREFQDTWTYSGEGFVLVDDINYQVVVLEEHHITDGGIHLAFTEAGTQQFGLSNSPAYEYWFDIVTPKAGTTVLANYNWNLTEAGEKVLKENDIPIVFAAVLTNTYGAATSYYFAGDYNDVTKVPRFYQLKGISKFNKFAESFTDHAFYWSTYVPMVETILKKFNRDLEKEPLMEANEEVLYNARVQNGLLEIKKENQWIPMTVKGVNMGMGKPGHFPGEAAITEDEYYRWFEQIGEMNANTVRVYTLHPPGFYDALKRYNDTHDEKIYVMHGVWINEEKLEESLDAFEPENLQDFQEEMKTIVDVIHGNKIVPDEPGHASGVYRSDVSEFVSAWILGIEWYPFMVLETNEKHASIGDYTGTYFETKNAEPFEYWLAEQMDLITAYELEHYNWIRPMSFTNWPTTDILDHPADSSNQEDIVGVDPNVIYTRNEMKLTGQFASYHIYPYYPDFLNYEEKYRTYVDHRGEENNYAGYLADLHAVHRLPILVAEFGVPGSRGKTHENPFGRNQGFLSEREQGEIIRDMFDDIMEENLMGGLVFTWQDEWFKRTWNTMDYDDPDRRPFWSNAQTNEEQFGLLSFDRHKIQVDGEVRDWETDALYVKEDGPMQALYVDHDERYLYIRLDYDESVKGYPLFLLDVIPNQGNHFIAGNEKLQFVNGIDFLINLSAEESRIVIDQYYDFYLYQYGIMSDFIQPRPKEPVNNSGIFSPIYYVLNREYHIPVENKTIPFQAYETGKLREGDGNPDSAAYDSLVDYSLNGDGMVEVRIPWLLIQSRDPSQKKFIGNMYEDGFEASEIVEEIFIGALYMTEEEELIDSFPSMTGNQLPKLQGYTWENWDLPLSEERLKQSYYIVQELYESYK